VHVSDVPATPDAPVADAPVNISFTVGLITMDPHRIIYSTILLMVAYAIYNEGTDPLGTQPYLTLGALSIAPLFALTMAHVFSDALDLQIRKGRRLTGADRRHLLAVNLQYMYIAIPPILLITVLGLMRMPADGVIRIVLLLGLVSLGWWGYFAGRQAGVPRLRRWIFAVNYLVMGMIVIGIELLLTH
jgi:hypothetical protein